MGIWRLEVILIRGNTLSVLVGVGTYKTYIRERERERDGQAEGRKGSLLGDEEERRGEVEVK